MIRLALIHPQPIYRQGVALLLESLEDVQLVAAVSGLKELIHQFHKEVFDIVLWNLSGHHALVPGLQLIREHYPITKVMVLTDTSHGLYTGFLINLGADAVIASHVTIDHLRHSMIALSRSYAPPPSSNHVQDPESPKTAKSRLSEDELMVLQLICKGASTLDIALELKLSVDLVKQYRQDLKKKLKVNNTATLIKAAKEHTLIPIENNQK